MRSRLDGGTRSTTRWCALAIVAAITMLGSVLVGCSDASRSRCDRICTREAGCAEELRVENDRLECIEACVTLEREPATRTLIMAHVACVDEAAGCAQVMACE